MDRKSITDLTALAGRLGATLNVDDGNCINIFMPPTKRQKSNQGDHTCFGYPSTWPETIQAAYDWLVNWEELWSLRLSVTNAQIKEYLRNRLTEDRQAIRAMELIYNYQTPTEQDHKRTEIRNNLGFSGVDAELMTSFVNQYKTRGFLSKKQMEIVRRVMKKYWRQVKEASDEKSLLKMVKKAQPDSTQTRLDIEDA